MNPDAPAPGPVECILSFLFDTEPATGVYPHEHAARLRLLRCCLGMLEHPDMHLVFDSNPEAEQGVRYMIQRIRRTTDVSEDDCYEYGRAAAKELRVIERDGEYLFTTREE